MGKAAGQKLLATDLPQVGTASIPAQTVASGANSTAATVTFPTPFPSVPQVVVSVTVGVNGFLGTPRVLSTTTSGFQVIVPNIAPTSQTWGSAIVLSWIASI